MTGCSVSQSETWWYIYIYYLLGFKWYVRGVEVKAVPLHAKQALEPQLESTGCGQRHAPGGITLGKRPESRDRSEWIRNMSCPPGFEPRTVQPVASGCTD